jgi:hypothetical protein
MILVGPSLGAAVAIDFAVNYPEAVSVSLQMSSLSNNACNGYLRKCMLCILIFNSLVSIIKQVNIFWFCELLVLPS